MNIATQLFPPSVVWMLVGSVFIPLISSLLVRSHWPLEVQGYFTLALSAIGGLVSQWANGDPSFSWRAAGLAALASFVLAAVGRLVAWANSTVNDKLVQVGSKKTHRRREPRVS